MAIAPSIFTLQTWLICQKKPHIVRFLLRCGIYNDGATAISLKGYEPKQENKFYKITQDQ